MDLIRTLLLSLVLAFLAYVAVYALFSLFTVLGFVWSFLILFGIFFLLVGTMPHAGNSDRIVISQRSL